MSQTRAYLDWNASAPLRPEARDAMLAAMGEVGNPSSVHAEGRKAKAIVERARAQVADLVGCEPGEVVFTSGATEAIQIVFGLPWDVTGCSAFEHDAVTSRSTIYDENPYASEGMSFSGDDGAFRPDNAVSGFGMYAASPKRGDVDFPKRVSGLFALCAANSETGVVQPLAETFSEFNGEVEITAGFTDATQSVGKVDFGFSDLPAAYAACSGHKLGAAKGVGALLIGNSAPFTPPGSGGGQESSRRAGTENVIGIAGFGAAAEAAKRDLEAGVWEGVEALRNRLEDRLASAAPDLLIFGKDAPRLPNTCLFAIPGWKGETQVMQMDLAGFAISAGSACSSGKVEKASRVLMAMGFDEITASSAIRVSIGPTTTEAEVMAFADAWEAAYRRWRNKAA